jgi:tetratricopeptide (TPR) repeat protein
MTMKRLLLLAAVLTLAACSSTRHHDSNPYAQPFYQRYLNTGSWLDAQITRTVNDLRANPRSASLHNTLGQLLLQKGFPQDAETEFERAVNADSHFYPGWYNLGLVRMSRSDLMGAHFAFTRTVHYKPGHSAALFQLGLMEEKRNHQRAAIDYYAKAFSINHLLLDVRVNPRILDSKLVDVALLKAYPKEHARESMAFNPTPPGYVQEGLEAPSPQATPAQIVTPAAPAPQPAKPPAKPPV